MSPLDKQLITRKIKLIEEDLAKLEEFENLSLDDYLNSFDIRLKVERLLERIVGRVIDINYHLLKEEFKTIPNDYYKSFIMFADNKVIDKKFAEELAESTGLRNALAHEYDRIDDTQVYKSIKICLSQIPRYLSVVLEKYT